jgi:hypothetical protein
MEAVARAAGGAVFGDWVWQPRPHGELLVPFPERAPGPEVVERAHELGARRIGVWLQDESPAIEGALPSLGFTAGWGRTWWLHLSDRRSSAAAPDRPS